MTGVWMAIFAIGIAAAISGSAKTPADASSMTIFGVGVGIAVVGLIGWWWRQGQAAASDDAGDPRTDPVSLLRAVLPPAQALQADMDALSEAEVCERVDLLLLTAVQPLVAQRAALSARLGVMKGAEIQSMVAFGERMLNRTWSAASDGHLPEARASLFEAVAAFEAAAEALEQAVSA
ncbi:MAG: hypothetical protein AAFV53_04495 [Myxococcota bacterium]